MTFSGHIAVTILSLQVTQNPWVIIPANLILHLLTDAIPHMEWQQPRHTTPWGRFFITIDCIVTLFLVGILVTTNSPLWVCISAGIAGVLPDLTDQLARRHWKGFRRFHDGIHTWPQPPSDHLDWKTTATGNIPRWLKIGFQAGLIIAAITVGR